MNFKHHKAVIFSVSGEVLLEQEKLFFSKAMPLGFILFSRNIKDKAQVRKLVADLRESVGNPDAPIFLDQEGGRVARLKRPFWYHPFAASVFGKLALKSLSLAKEACELNARLIAHEMMDLGINIDCAPVADILQDYSSNVIGDRSYGSDKYIVAELANAMAIGLSKGGVQPIIKHIPGHGRARLDSHFALPEVSDSYEVLKEDDFYPFEQLSQYKWAMTAHVLYESIDPNNPATLSSKVINEIRNTIGFKGLLVSDCITMKALEGSMSDRASSAFSAGCDIVIYSHPNLNEMHAIIDVTPNITDIQNDVLVSSYNNVSLIEDVNVSSLKIRLREILESNLNKEDLLFSSFDPTEQLH